MTDPIETKAAESTLQAFRPVPRTGVIYATNEAVAKGYREQRCEWSNLGQGQPEAGPLPGAVGLSSEEQLEQLTEQLVDQLGDPGVASQLARSYGSRAPAVLQLAAADPGADAPACPAGG